MRKIIDKQLALASHPAAAALLPGPVLRSLALVKGWLFYPAGQQPGMDGIAAGHCHGFWCALDEFDADGSFVVLPRMQWLAPYKSASNATVMDGAQLRRWLVDYFAQASMPALVAEVSKDGNNVLETRRGFIVPNDWLAKAAAKTGQP